jgi:hypothetical protein
VFIWGHFLAVGCAGGLARERQTTPNWWVFVAAGNANPRGQ